MRVTRSVRLQRLSGQWLPLTRSRLYCGCCIVVIVAVVDGHGPGTRVSSPEQVSLSLTHSSTFAKWEPSDLSELPGPPARDHLEHLGGQGTLPQRTHPWGPGLGEVVFGGWLTSRLCSV